MAWKNRLSAEEKPFNFAQLLLERLNDLFKVANESRYSGDVFKWYNALNSISTSLSFKLTEEEELEINKELINIQGKIKTANNLKSEVFFLTVRTSLDDLEKKLVKLMFKYGLYYPEKVTKLWQDKVKDK